MTEPGQRLSSWKEIAAYLARDVRTVMRWEKERGLPVHRGPGKRGVVYAEPAELDAWVRGVEDAPVADAPLRRRIWAVAALVVFAAGLSWLAFAGGRHGVVDAILTDRAVIARSADGAEQWRYSFGDNRVEPPFSRWHDPIEMFGSDGLIAATSHSLRADGTVAAGGQLLWLSNRGAIERTFSFDDRLRFGSRTFSGPWAINDYRLAPGSGSARRLAVTGRHYDWWPSMVSVLDANGHRGGTFVNAGWLDHVLWLNADRLIVAGFANPRDGGMVALLDANHLDGQSPADTTSAFACQACGNDRPLRYIVMPRSEVNRAADAPFNRAFVSPRPDRLLVSTIESPGSASVTAATAVYEFSPELELLSAAYTDRYWELHRDLERTGKISHSREECPERDGPRQIAVWEPRSGWRIQPARSITP